MIIAHFCFLLTTNYLYQTIIDDNMKNVLIINGNPKTESYCKELANAYERGAKSSKAKVKRIEIGALKFNPNLKEGYNEIMPLEKDLQKAQEDIKWADHIVFIYPIWWGYLPAVTKGFFDRIFVPRFAFSYRRNPTWEKWFQDDNLKSSFISDGLLTPKTGRVIATSGGPRWFYDFLLSGAPNLVVKNLIFRFCGIKAKSMHVGWVERSKERRKWGLRKVKALGKKLK